MLYVFVGIIFIAIAVIILLLKHQKKRSLFPIAHSNDPLKITIDDIDRMADGSEFEEYLEKLLQLLGYSDAYKTVSSHDFGADLVFTDQSGTRTIVQAKRYGIDNPVRLDAVQQVYTARNYYQAKKAIVIASTSYTHSCDTLAGVNGVLLLDRSDLITIIDALKTSDLTKAKKIIEREPRVIYEFWDDPDYTKQIKKDKRFVYTS